MKKGDLCASPCAAGCAVEPHPGVGTGYRGHAILGRDCPAAYISGETISRRRDVSAARVSIP